MASLDEYQKFLASAPQAQREYRTIEFYHPNAPTAVQRFVADYTDISLTLENTAPRQAGISVLFTAIPMKIIEPAEDSESDSVINIQLGLVNSLIQDWLKTIPVENNLTPIDVIYRKYYSGDLSEPVLVLNSSVSSISFDGVNKNTIIAENTTLSSRKSGEIYTLERFVTLSGI